MQFPAQAEEKAETGINNPVNAMQTGTLFMVGTPIGNLEDITFRALRVLREVDLIACEDTRHTRKLLSHFDIHTPSTSYHEHNSRLRGKWLVNELCAGKNIALVSDAGQPVVSDPGAELVAQCLERGIKVVPVPGPSAATAALTVAGLPAERFVFEGFLPSSGRLRKERIESLKKEERTVILYEAPHRLLRTLGDLARVEAGRPLVVAREMTKQYEEIRRGTVGEILKDFTQNPPRGEFTLVLAASSTLEEDFTPGEQRENEALLLVGKLMAEGMDKKAAIKKAAEATGLSRRDVYALLVKKD